MSFHSLNLANILGVDSPFLIAIIVPVTVFIVGGVIAVCAMYFHNRRQEMWHFTARTALDKGQPLPPPPEVPPARAKTEENDFRAGLILLGVGAGLYVFFSVLGVPQIRAVGAIPGFIGVALVLHGLGKAAFGRKNPSPTDFPPQS